MSEKYSHILQNNLILQSKSHPFTAFISLPEGKIATGSDDGTIMVFSKNYKVLHKIRKTSDVVCMCHLTDNNFISCSLNDLTITIWEYRNKKNKYRHITIGTFGQGRLLRKLSNKYFGLLDYSRITIYDTTFPYMNVAMLGGSFTNFIGLSDGRIATASSTHKINFFNAESFIMYSQEYTNNKIGDDVEMIELKEGILGLSGRDQIVIYNTMKYEVSKIITNPNLGSFSCMIKMNNWFIGNNKGNVIVLDENDKFIVHKNGHKKKIKTMIFNNDMILTLGDDNLINIWIYK